MPNPFDYIPNPKTLKKSTQEIQTLAKAQTNSDTLLFNRPLSDSALKKWLACREQFRIKYLLGWQQNYTSDPLEFGKAFGAIHERINRKRKPLRTINGALRSYQQEWLDENQALTQVSPDEPAASIQEKRQKLLDFQIISGRAATAYSAHHNHYHDKDKNLKWLGRELRVEFSITVPAGPYLRSVYKIESVQVPFIGYLDGLFQRPGAPYPTILELKTRGSSDAEITSELLAVELQTNLYTLAIFQQQQELDHLQTCYDVTIRAKHKVTKADEKEPDPEASRNARVLEAMVNEPTRYFQRFNRTASRSDNLEWKNRYLLNTLSQFCDWYASLFNTETLQPLSDPFQSPLHFINPQSLTGAFGTRAEAYNPILNQTIDPTEFYRIPGRIFHPAR